MLAHKVFFILSWHDTCKYFKNIQTFISAHIGIGEPLRFLTLEKAVIAVKKEDEKMKRLIWGFALCSSLLLAPWQKAEALTFSANPGTLQDVTSVNDVVTSLGMVGGLQVTANFANGQSDILTWALPPASSPYASLLNFAGVAGSSAGGWSLMASGNTFAGLWYFDGGNSAITSMTIKGSNIAFDRTLPNPGTTGSFQGHDFAPDLGVAGSNIFKYGDGFTDDPAGWTATYSDAIGLNGASPLGDLYGGLTITFGTGGYSGNFSFLQDTDTFVPGTTTGGGGTSVPEPSTLLLLGSGMVGLAATRIRKFRKS